jgi:chaperonin GroES
MNRRPLHGRVIVHRLDEDQQNIGGIIIPIGAKEKPQQGTIVAAGRRLRHHSEKKARVDDAMHATKAAVELTDRTRAAAGTA